MFADNKRLHHDVLNKRTGKRRDGRYNFRYIYEPSKTANALKVKSWLAASDKSFHSAINITRSKLSPAYNLDLNGAKLLLSTLDIKDDINRKSDDTSQLTESQREKIEFADKLKAMGIDESNLPDLAEFQAFKRQREAQRRSAENRAQGGSPQTGEDNPDFDFDDPSNDQEEVSGDGRGAGSRQSQKLNHTTVEVMRDIARRARETTPAVPAEDTGEDEE